MAIIREFIAAAILVVGFGSEAFCQVQALDAEVYQQAVREATAAYRGDVDNVVLVSWVYDEDDTPLLLVPSEFREQLSPVSTIPFQFRITLRRISQDFAWSLTRDLSN